jgi:L-lactate dehydrogenase complex protein LldF
VYTKIGGYPYGWAYSGPIGQLLNPLLLGLDKTGDLYRASTLCGNCKSVCPVGIDHPNLFLYFRSLDADKNSLLKAGMRPWKDSLFFALWRWAVSRSRRWNFLLKISRPFINRYTLNNSVSRGIGPVDQWLKARDLPILPKRTFRERWTQMKK